ncbi:hypothetical protein L596_019595 [Steinernema carpocapsae]|uniref:Uncharacterized protein n=1 Tax=Steinernema carpocapsae TaxID=34508 RepID=A0A4U5MR23_STECR|nr:hypothetical protein L596_019595 [Steinernema carpocapsae]
MSHQSINVAICFPATEEEHSKDRGLLQTEPLQKVTTIFKRAIRRHVLSDLVISEKDAINYAIKRRTRLDLCLAAAEDTKLKLCALDVETRSTERIGKTGVDARDRLRDVCSRSGWKNAGKECGFPATLGLFKEDNA